MVRIIKWYLIFSGLFFTILLLFGSVWFFRLPAVMQELIRDSVVGVFTGIVRSDVSRDSAVDEMTVKVDTPVWAASPIRQEQVDALESVGLTADALPKKFTDAQVICFEKVLGRERVAEIKNGSVPTLVEFQVAAECL